MYFYLIQIFILPLIAIIESKIDGIPCGDRPIELLRSSRIVGGKDAFYGEAPWQALIKESRFFGLWKYNKCGGVLIHHNWVITAAHCNSGLFGSLQVILGEHNLKTEEMVATDDSSFVESKLVIRKVKRIIVHPKYQPSTLENDLALIELDGSVQFERHIQPICLPEKGDQFIDAEAYVSGWGLLSYGNRTLPEALQIVKVPIMSNEECKRMYKTARQKIILRDTILCAGYAIGGKDSCEGDSGGPLAVRDEPGSKWTLAGIVSNGVKCAEPNLPGIYTRISEYRNWIIETINKQTSIPYN